MITVKDLRFSYGSRMVLDGVDLQVLPGEMLFILGPNGSGKSTLLKCMAGILKPRGAVYIGEEDLLKLSRGRVARSVGYLPQREGANELTVFEAVLLGRKPHMGWGPGRRDFEVVRRVIRMLGLEHLSLRRLTQLSGGELQKVLIARALAQEPKVILLDEPTASLDVRSQIEVMNLLRRIVRDTGVSAVVTTHDLNLASVYADRIVILSQGRIVASGGLEVLNSENVAEAYGVNLKIVYFDGRPVVIPV